MARSGLKKVVKTVRGKKGSVKRSYWVRASGAVKGAGKAARSFAGRHSGKLKVAAGLAALAGAAYGAHRAGAWMESAAHARAAYGAAREAGGTRMQAAGIGMRVGRLANRVNPGSVIGQLVASEARLTANNVGGLMSFATARPRAAMQRMGDRIALHGLTAPSNRPTIVKARGLMEQSQALRARRPR